MIEFFDPLFNVPHLGAGRLTQVREAAAREVMLVCNVLRTQANSYRSKLGLRSISDAWRPTPEFAEEMAERLEESWRAAIKSLGDLSVHLVAAAVSYDPVRRTWIKTSQPESEAAFLAKGAWKVAKAIKSAGLSVAFDVGKFFFRAHQEQKKFERFRSLMEGGLEECKRLRAGISQARQQYRGTLSLLSEKLTYQVIFSIASPYGEMSGDQQR
ncbi:MAG: hypothetical protein ABL994_23455, partial [Verrucomicrobiales bacterium]